MDDGVRPAADAFLDGADGTFAALATTFLRNHLAATPHAVRAVAERMDATDLGRLTTTLADPEVRANRALVAVGHQVVTRLDGMGTPHAAAFLDDLGVQPVADLSVGTAASGDMAAMRRIGASFVDVIGGMEIDAQARWLSLLGVAIDRAGVVPLLLSSTDAPPRSFLPLLLASEGSGAMVPRSDDVVSAVHELTGDWRRWSAGTYTALLRATPGAADTLVDAMSGWPSDPGLHDVIERHWDARTASEVILHAGGSAGLDTAVSDWSATHPEFLTSLATSVRRITESRDEALVAVMRMVHAAGNPNQVLARYIDHAMSSIGTGRSLSLDDVFEIGQQVAIVQAASRPTRVAVDGTGLVVDGSIAVASTALGPAIDAVDILLSNVSVEGPDFNPGIAQRRAILAGTAPLTLARVPDGDDVLRALGFERNRSGSWFLPPGRVLDADRHHQATPGVRGRDRPGPEVRGRHPGRQPICLVTVLVTVMPKAPAHTRDVTTMRSHREPPPRPGVAALLAGSPPVPQVAHEVGRRAQIQGRRFCVEAGGGPGVGTVDGRDGRWFVPRRGAARGVRGARPRPGREGPEEASTGHVGPPLVHAVDLASRYNVTSRCGDPRPGRGRPPG